MSIVLITGSNGLVGSKFAFFFLKKGFKVIGIDNNFRKNFLVVMEIHYGYKKN